MLPTIIQGDFNEVPSTLKTVKKLMEEHCWIDVGEVAHWWEGEPNVPTCHAKARANPSRIDGIVCNLEVATMTHSFKVEKDEMIPTHSIITITVSRNAMAQKRSFARNLPSLERPLMKRSRSIWKNGGCGEGESNGQG